MVWRHNLCNSIVFGVGLIGFRPFNIKQCINTNK
jgi:hypothetical protein